MRDLPAADAASDPALSPIEAWDLIGGRLDLVARMGDGENDTALFRTRMAPSSMVPLHGHVDPERFHVLAGRLEVFLAGDEPRWHTVPAGRSLLVANGIRHALRNSEQDAADIVLVTNNRLARFFREAGRPADATGGFGHAGPADIDRVVRTAEAYGYWMSTPAEHEAATR